MKDITEAIGKRCFHGIVVEFIGTVPNKRGWHWKLLCDCGNEYIATTSSLNRGQQKSCGKCDFRKYSEKRKNTRLKVQGDRYNSLVVIDDSYKIDKSGDRLVKCLCDCGKEKDIKLSAIRIGKIKSCGCRPLRVGREHPNYRGYEDISQILWISIKNSAIKRKIDFSISIEYAWSIFLLQDRKCVLSGVELFFDISRLDNNGNASLDRINSNLGYIEGNVQWVHADINKIKNNFQQERFLELCELIAQYKKEKLC